jgi:hypothetical protein
VGDPPGEAKPKLTPACCNNWPRRLIVTTSPRIGCHDERQALLLLLRVAKSARRCTSLGPDHADYRRRPVRQRRVSEKALHRHRTAGAPSAGRQPRPLTTVAAVAPLKRHTAT